MRVETDKAVRALIEAISFGALNPLFAWFTPDPLVVPEDPSLEGRNIVALARTGERLDPIRQRPDGEEYTIGIDDDGFAVVVSFPVPYVLSYEVSLLAPDPVAEGGLRDALLRGVPRDGLVTGAWEIGDYTIDCALEYSRAIQPREETTDEGFRLSAYQLDVATWLWPEIVPRVQGTIGYRMFDIAPSAPADGEEPEATTSNPDGFEE